MVTNQIGKYEPITFFVGVNPEFQVEGVVVMVYREGYGSDVRKKRFVRQFKSKTIKDPLAVNQDITSDQQPLGSTYWTRHTGTLINMPIGTGMTVNTTGHWTFPSTGFYEITFIDPKYFS